MILSIPKEIAENETRIAATPETVGKFFKKGLSVTVQSAAGQDSLCPDEAYRSAGASVEPDTRKLYGSADVILKVQRPLALSGAHEVDHFKPGTTLISFLYPLAHPDLLIRLNAKRVTSFAVDMIPRIARAQKLDALSSQSNVAGYKAVLLGANALSKMMPMMMTAAGTILPAKVFVVGAGVAGLQAIATAKRLGAVVEAFDTRPAVKGQVESLGAKFVALDLGAGAEDARGYARELTDEEKRKEKELLARHFAQSDLVITTALVPGRPAPKIIAEENVRSMRPGSVIVDLAADAGGNCALTEPGLEVEKHGVRVIGYFNLATRMAAQASQLYARNLHDFFMEMFKEGRLNVDLSNPVLKESLVTHEGRTVNALVLSKMSKGS